MQDCTCQDYSCNVPGMLLQEICKTVLVKITVVMCLEQDCTCQDYSCNVPGLLLREICKTVLVKITLVMCLECC